MASEDFKADCEVAFPDNGMVTPILTDLYQITMAYAYWKAGRHNEPSVFDLFFRKNPFQGEFTIFAGLTECVKFVANYKFLPQDIAHLKEKFPNWEPGFVEYLTNLDTSEVKVYAVREGTLVFPRIPLLRIEGPLGICQLLETTLLVLCNFSSLVATNAARHRLAVGNEKMLFEFGLRRAQGPDGAMSASKYSYIGGFDGTSNVAAGLKYGINIKGTHAHAFVSSFIGFDDLGNNTHLTDSQDNKREFAAVARKYRDELGLPTNLGELAAFISYAQAYPSGFMALVDTYDTLNSGVPNFLSVALALHEFGHKALGIRLDSGDLAYLSKEARKMFQQAGDKYGVEYLGRSQIVASNDLNEAVLYSLKEQGHEIDGFGVGTNLVTCQAQPALGGVYKLVEVKGHPRIKVSQEPAKVTVPGRKEAYRLYDSTDKPILDLMVLAGSTVPRPGQKILCRHPFDEKRRCFVTPSRVEALHELVWDGRLTQPLPSLADVRARCQQQLHNVREDHLRRLNPTPYKVSVTSELYTFMHDLWLAEAPVPEYS